MYKLLIVDDEQIERMALARRLLKRFGENLVILQAVDGTEAIKLCSQERCQIVIMEDSKGCAGYSAYRYKDACYEWY